MKNKPEHKKRKFVPQTISKTLAGVNKKMAEELYEKALNGIEPFQEKIWITNRKCLINCGRFSI